jgi:hypothetical protein
MLWEFRSPVVNRNGLLVGQDVILAGDADDEVSEWNVPQPRATVQKAEPRAKFFQAEDKEERVTCVLVRLNSSHITKVCAPKCGE